MLGTANHITYAPGSQANTQEKDGGLICKTLVLFTLKSKFERHRNTQDHFTDAYGWRLTLPTLGGAAPDYECHT